VFALGVGAIDLFSTSSMEVPPRIVALVGVVGSCACNQHLIRVRATLTIVLGTSVFILSFWLSVFGGKNWGHSKSADGMRHV
jgi:hypothetical protein